MGSIRRFLIAGISLALLFGAVSKSAAVVEFEPNDSTSDINVIVFTPGVNLQGNFDQCSTALCPDYWQFNAAAGNRYTFVCTPTGCINANNDPDVGLEIRNVSDGLVTGTDLHGSCSFGGAAETLIWIAPSSGTFYLVVYEATDFPTAGVAGYNTTTAVSAAGTPTPTATPSMTPTPTVSPTPGIVSATQITLPTNDLIYDTNASRLFASVPSRAGYNGNTIAMIDPTTGDIGPFVYVGSEPGRMAVTDNGEYLYVILNGASVVVRFNAATLQTEARYDVGMDGFNEVVLSKDIARLPGNPLSVIVSRLNAFVSPNTAGIVVIDNGVRRPIAGPGDQLAVADSGAFAYSYRDQSGSFDFFRMQVTAAGLITSGSLSLFSGFTTDFEYENGLVYSTSGVVADPDLLAPAGTFAATGPVEADSTNNRIFAIDTGPNALEVFNLTTQAFINSVSLTPYTGTKGSLIRWGTNGLAFRTTNDRVILMRATNAAILPAGANPTPAPPPPISGPDQLPVLSMTPRVINFVTNDLVYDKFTGKIYASVPDSVAVIGGSITEINPVTGTVGASTPVGSDPNKLALSRDGQYLYVGLDGTNQVRRLTLNPLTPGPTFSIGPSMTVYDMDVSATTPTLVAVSRSDESIVIYDDGTALPNIVSGFDEGRVIEFSNDGALLYGYNNTDTGFEFFRFTLDSTGISTPTLDVTDYLVNGFTTDMRFNAADGLLYTTMGRAINGDTKEVVGTYTDPLGASFVLVDSDSSVNRTYFISGFAPYSLKVYDQQHFLKIGTFPLAGISLNPTSLVHFSPTGLAFRTSTQIWLLDIQDLNAAQHWSDYE